MKVVLQNFRTGELSLGEVPPPTVRPGGVLVRNAASLVSAGTEKAIMELAKMNPLQKARARPDLVKKVLSKAGQEGLLATAQIVSNLVSAPIPLGYSSAGVVEAVGAGVADLKPGDRVACAGLGFANHAQVVFVPRNLVTPIPDGVTYESACFVTLGAIAVQGVRQADVRVGEAVVVIGLGLLGQLTVQICAAAGCRVFGIDVDPARAELARQLGAHDAIASKAADPREVVRAFTRGRGADVVIVTAATQSSEPIDLAADLARDRARIVAVGDVGLEVPRRKYFEKELELRLSRSYGPGRYDPQYEEKGIDYPIGYVRWTENRNMESFLDLVSEQKVQVTPLVTHRFPIERARDAYDLLEGRTVEPYLGIVLEYDLTVAHSKVVEHVSPDAEPRAKASAGKDSLGVGLIGTGQFAQGILLPKLRDLSGVRIVGVATATGITAATVATRYKAAFSTSDYRELLSRPEVNAVVVATRHNLHAEIVAAALAAGKHVFVEKPLAIDLAGLDEIRRAYTSAEATRQQPTVTVGFNRRFSPYSVALRDAFEGKPKIMQYRVNAGPIPATNWVQDAEIGGGRIVGEVCHFIDLMQFLTSADPVSVFASAISGGGGAQSDPDSLCVQLQFSDGSIGSVTYAANGDQRFPKERLEVFGGGRVGVIDNWRALLIQGGGRSVKKRLLLTAAKGHAEELSAFVDGARRGVPPIEFRSLVLTTLATFAIQQSLRLGEAVPVTAGDHT